MSPPSLTSKQSDPSIQYLDLNHTLSTTTANPELHSHYEPRTPLAFHSCPNFYLSTIGVLYPRIVRPQKAETTPNSKGKYKYLVFSNYL